MNDQTDVSIIVCTRNRAESLRLMLTAVARVDIPANWSCELLVIDNASTDRTREVVQDCQMPGVPVRYICEPKVGKSHAYNTSLKGSRGRVLLFIDDDIWPPRNWLASMCEPILAGKADAVAGGVKLSAQVERRWMKACHRAVFAVTEDLDAAAPQQLFGANMAFSRAALGRVPAFDPELGPGQRLACHEDSLFSWQLQKAGFKLTSAFNAVCEHQVEESRLQRSAWLDYACKQQYSWAYIRHHWKHETIKSPRRQLWWYRFCLGYMRLRHLGDWLGRKEGAAEWEMSLVGGISFYKQYLIERKRPYNYEAYGLVKRCGL